MSKSGSGPLIFLTAVIGALVVLSIITVVALSPLAMAAAVPNSLTNDTLQRISNIGQTYGAASAVLSAIALLGVGASIILQILDSRNSREQNMRILHLDLFRIALDDPKLLDCWGKFSSSTNVAQQRHLIYANLIVSFWRTAFETGGMGENELRIVADGFFDGKIGREYWTNAKQSRKRSAMTHRSRCFITILDERYEAAVAKINQQAPAKKKNNARKKSHTP
jgi:hypothetical protein